MNGVMRDLRVFARAQPQGALSPNWSDLWFLYSLVRKRKPKTLLEFGSGWSSVVLAAAVRDNGAGKLWSVETDQHWADVTEKAFPESLRSIVTVVRSEALPEDRDVAGWLHANVPDIDPDFLYLDGPPLNTQRRVAFDPLDLEPRFQPGFVMVVDGRKTNSIYLRDHLQRRYAFRHIPLTCDPGRFVFELRS
jgi:hypothetical protein